MGLDAEQGASFYDFLMWYVASRGGVFSYDFEARQYRLTGAKASKGKPLVLSAKEVEAPRVVFPEVIRHEVSVLNAWAEGPKTEAVPQPQSVAGVRQDVLVRAPLQDEVQRQVKREKARLVARGMEVELTWRRFPVTALAPGALVRLPEQADWAASGVPAKQTFRVRQVQLRGEAREPGPDDEVGGPHTAYACSLVTRLERQEEAWVELPAYLPPGFPRLAEGFIVSEVGEKKDETWQAYKDDGTSLESYRVRFPLWKDQVITVPFEPGLLPGHFYFPAYKGARVLVALDFQHASLERFLDWRAGARLPADGQGVQLLVGKSTGSHTALKHFYEENKPVFQLHRVNEKDSVKVQLREGGLILEVKGK